MNTRSTLLEIESLLDKARGLLRKEIDSQRKPTPGKPPQPQWRENGAATLLYDGWDKLRGRTLTARQAKGIVTGKSNYDSSFSACLSKWAWDGHIETAKIGSGRKPT